jgi:hypothetical protein
MLFSCTENDIVGRSVIFILVSSLSVFWHFNGGPDVVAACKYKAASDPITSLIADLPTLQDINLPIAV